jgi:kynurenine formamidase
MENNYKISLHNFICVISRIIKTQRVDIDKIITHTHTHTHTHARKHTHTHVRSNFCTGLFRECKEAYWLIKQKLTVIGRDTTSLSHSVAPQIVKVTWDTNSVAWHKISRTASALTSYKLKNSHKKSTSCDASVPVMQPWMRRVRGELVWCL